MSMRELIETWWPVALPLLAIAGSAIRTETIVGGQQVAIDRLREEGVPSTNERLARLETKIDMQNGTLVRIDEKLDQGVRRDDKADRLTADDREATLDYRRSR